jgi:hypothetical protein
VSAKAPLARSSGGQKGKNCSVRCTSTKARKSGRGAACRHAESHATTSVSQG